MLESSVPWGHLYLLFCAAERRASMVRKRTSMKLKDTRRRYTEEFKNEAVQMLLDGHSASSVMDRLGLPK